MESCRGTLPNDFIGGIMFLILFAFLVTSAHNGTRNYEECKALQFVPKACWESEQMEKAGKFLKKI